MAGLGLDGETTYDLMLATTEAFANAVEHGAPCESPEGDCIRVRVECETRAIGVEVCDCGGCFPADVPASPKPYGEGGRGIPIISAVMDRLEVVPGAGATRVRFEKRLAPA